MRRQLMAAVLLMSCSVGACTEKRIAKAIKTPAARLVCEPAGDRPSIPAEYVIDWTRVTTVPQARSEHDAYVRSVRTREGLVAGYIVSIEGKLFVCADNAQWRKDFEAGLPETVEVPAP